MLVAKKCFLGWGAVTCTLILNLAMSSLSYPEPTACPRSRDDDMYGMNARECLYDSMEEEFLRKKYEEVVAEVV